MRWSSARRRSWGVWSPSCAPAAQHHGGHHDSGLEDDLSHPDPGEGEKARECSGDTHGRPSFVRLPEQLRTYGPVRVTSRSASRPTWSRLLSSILPPAARCRSWYRVRTRGIASSTHIHAGRPSSSRRPSLARTRARPQLGPRRRSRAEPPAFRRTRTPRPISRQGAVAPSRTIVSPCPAQYLRDTTGVTLA